MSNYTLDPNCCRVDIWKDSGKWYTTEVINFKNSDYNGCIQKAFKNALNDHPHIRKSYSGMTITCLEPYNKNSHPVSIVNWRW